MRYFNSGCSHFLVLLLLFRSLTVSLTAQGLSAPTLQATPFDISYVALQWTDWEAYRTNRIERKSGGSDWSLIAETGQANSYMDRATVSGVTYTYRVQALTSDGSFTYSNEASATTPGPTLQPPAAQYFVADVSFNNFFFRWNPVAGLTQLKIEAMDATAPWHEIASLGASSSNFLVTPLIEGMTYHFRFRASNHAGVSPYTTLPITAPYDPQILPQSPSIFASPRTDKSISLQWDYVPRAWGYLVESRSSPSGSWTQIINVGRDVTSAVHVNLQPSTQYFYRILAYNGAGNSSYSPQATTSTYPPPPSSPQLQGLQVSYKEIELRWSDVLTNCCTSPGNIGYRLESWNGSAWTEIHFAGVDDTNHFVTGLQPSTEYTYRIVALHPLASVWSTNTVRTMDPPPIPPPSAPIFYADQYSAIAIALKWIDVCLETEYRIERENFPGGDVWQQIAVVPANSTSYLDVDREPGTLYAYRIRAANSYGTSPHSHEAAAWTRNINGDIVISSITPSETGATFRLRLTGAAGQKFKVQSTTDFESWTDGAEPLTLTTDMEVEVSSVGSAAFYRTIKTN